jgi:hypothetical protein
VVLRYRLISPPQNFLTNEGRRRYSVGHKDRFDLKYLNSLFDV